MWMMFAVRDGRLCTKRIRKSLTLVLWVCRLCRELLSKMHFAISIMLSFSSLPEFSTMRVNPELSILHLFPLFTFFSKSTSTVAFMSRIIINNRSVSIFNVLPFCYLYCQFPAILSNNASQKLCKESRWKQR